MNTAMTVSFQLKRVKKNSQNKAPIYARITIKGDRCEFTLKKCIDVSRWCNKAGKVKGTNEDARSLNHFLNTVRLKLNECHRKLIENDQEVSSAAVRDLYFGKAEKQKTLVEVFELHNTKIEELIGKDYSLPTLTKFKTTLQHVKNFILRTCGKLDVTLSEVNYGFLTDFEHYLKVEANLQHNTAMKYIAMLGKIVNIAIAHQWIAADPFASFPIRLQKVDRDFLTAEELELLVTKEIGIKRLSQIRDIFVFACFTGLAFSELEKLSRHHIVESNGHRMVKINRTKTDTRSAVTLLTMAEEILKKYQNDPACSIKNRLLPVPSNQKMNAYLKEIATICGIEKNLTSHVARHTFATTVTLSNDIPIETVSKMLGHRSIKTTQIYARIVDKKINEDMSKIGDRFKRLEGKVA
jgi:site-specific recombinase XerD